VGFFKNTRVVFLVGPNYINPEDNYGPLIDFLSQIAKLFYFNVIGLADFKMYNWFPISFFVLISSHTCACNMCFVSSFVINWQFRLIDHNGTQKPVFVLSPSSRTYNSHIKKTKSFLRTICAFSIIV